METEINVEAALKKLRASVRAAEDEALLAVMLHESWKPTAYDEGLHERMGTSFATHTFQIVRMALRREVLMALTRVWDSNKRAVRLTGILEVLRNERCFDALVREHAASLNLEPAPVEAMRQALEVKRSKVLDLIRKYMQDGEGEQVMKGLKSLRHERLAHRQLEAPARVSEREATEEQIEMLYQDTLEIVSLLLSLVLGHAFDIATDAAGVYRHHASYFWSAARGERTEGHPKFRPHLPHSQPNKMNEN